MSSGLAMLLCAVLIALPMVPIAMDPSANATAWIALPFVLLLPAAAALWNGYDLSEAGWPPPPASDITGNLPEDAAARDMETLTGAGMLGNVARASWTFLLIADLLLTVGAVLAVVAFEDTRAAVAGIFLAAPVTALVIRFGGLALAWGQLRERAPGASRHARAQLVRHGRLALTMALFGLGIALGFEYLPLTFSKTGSGIHGYVFLAGYAGVFALGLAIATRLFGIRW